MLGTLRKKVRDEGAEEVVATYLDRIRDSKLNAFITVLEEQAMEEARNPRPGRLSGIPIAVKDNISTRGVPTTCGSNILTGYIPPFDATVVERLKEEGAIIIGKTNMDEFAMGTSTETSYYGPTRNPWDLDRVPGGSSGGSAAAVAGGEAPISLGSDTGGSVRCPAAFCGIVGLKPTYGAISRYGLIAYANSLELIGPMATSVRDTAELYEVVKCQDPFDSTSVEAPSVLDHIREDVSDLVLGVPREFFEGADPGVEKAVWDALHKLEELGARYQEISLPNMRYALSAYYVIAVSEASSNLARYDGLRYGLEPEVEGDWNTMFSDVRARGFGEEVKRRILLGTYALSAGYYGKYYLKALKARTLIRGDFDAALRDSDVLITPTMPFPAFKIGERIADPLQLYLADVNTVPINLAGLPSVSLPCGYSKGLPIGLQLIGRYFDEQTLLRTAHTFEQNTDFQRLPEVA